MDCPNFERCGGELRFTVHMEHDGSGEWRTFVGYSAECVEQTCSCALTDEQWSALERAACEDNGATIYDNE